MLKNILFGGLTISILMFYHNYSVFIIYEDALLKSGVHAYKVFNKKVKKYAKE